MNAVSTTCHTLHRRALAHHSTGYEIHIHAHVCAHTQHISLPSPLPSRHTTALAIRCTKQHSTQKSASVGQMQGLSSSCSLHPAVWGLVLDTKEKGPEEARLFPPCTHTRHPPTPHPSLPHPPPPPSSAAE